MEFFGESFFSFLQGMEIDENLEMKLTSFCTISPKIIQIENSIFYKYQYSIVYIGYST